MLELSEDAAERPPARRRLMDRIECAEDSRGVKRCAQYTRKRGAHMFFRRQGA